ncbi:MAG: hypothetical protein H7345_14540 [Rubritepida sp.]|nr:hypothetical protein [Rubritepida sp.]
MIAHRLAATGFTAEAPNAATLTRSITADMARWRDVVRQTELSVDG